MHYVGYFLLLILSATPAFANTDLPILPFPAELTRQQGQFQLSNEFAISLPDNNSTLSAATERFKQRLSQRTGLSFNAEAPPVLLLQLTGPESYEKVPAAEMNEYYQLRVTPAKIELQAPATTGLLRGLETLLQLVRITDDAVTIPALTIIDQPRFRWRGLLLDPARRFLPVPTLKRQLDLMAAVKLNVLHLHLTDDQGWRFESLRYPRLHEVGGRDGYYTQQQLRELVQYAAQRGIRIVPEIDLPGHTTALGAAYPELMAAPGPATPERHWGVHKAVLDPSNEQVYIFLTNLLAEVAAVFPDRYLHIGGDEVLPDHWLTTPHIVDFMQQQQLPNAPALQAYFNNRLQKIVQQLNRQMIGWDEVLDDKLPGSVLVQSWRGTESLANAARAGHQAILSTGYYLDQPQFASYHYRNDPLPEPVAMPELSTLEHWSAWQFQFNRKRGSAISGQLLLLHMRDGSSQALLQFTGRQPQLLSQFTINANQLHFYTDSWMGPLQGSFITEMSTCNIQQPSALHGQLLVGNAFYHVRGHPVALQQPASVPLPFQLPQQQLDAASEARIIGGEIALWGELVTPDNIDIRLWPNGFAVAERLWSAASLQDEQNLYWRMQQRFDQLTADNILQTVAQQQQGLSLLAGPAKLAALTVLSQTLEPGHYYHRLHEKSVAGAYHADEPLNRLVDFLRAEHPQMRQFTRQTAGWLADENPDTLAALLNQLQQWQQAAEALTAVDKPALVSLAGQVAALSQSGQLLLNRIQQQQPLTAAERKLISGQLAQGATLQQEMIIALHRPLQKLLEFAPHSEVWLAPDTFAPTIEGPAVDSKGNLYAVNFAVESTIGKVTPGGNASRYLSLPKGSIGNGIVFDKAGAMYIADYTAHNIWKYQHNQLSVHAHNSAMHQPNDLAILDNGVIFVSDPDWANNSGRVWRIAPDGNSKLVAEMGTTNGIAVSPDQQYLYVNESVQRRIWRFNINSDHSLSNKQLIARFSDYGLDGMRVDRDGNLFVARYGKGTVIKLNSNGTLLAEYRLNNLLPTNVSLNNDETLLYVTVQQCGCIERIPLTFD
ncbi:family 20 glycosylhydrolase [Arsukibacterium indicum]|uniref:beta-N-acetylhexosaminidase n=1 Tax=Arsukibacterium indicum TaxID=2848612 RepID=A0ABS6MIC2_9GAMM|nr:family 20 glycosylhydrolase [Arsukibacterium indicum]MBV2128566.1 family 20 glycosylhydrolase [Arsukibacterium indicum]